MDGNAGEVFGRFGRAACGFPAFVGVYWVGWLGFSGRGLARPAAWSQQFPGGELSRG